MFIGTVMCYDKFSISVISSLTSCGHGNTSRTMCLDEESTLGVWNCTKEFNDFRCFNGKEWIHDI